MRWRMPVPGRRLAVAALGVAALTAVAALWRAVTISPVPPAGGSPTRLLGVETNAVRDSVPREMVLAAVEHDPFHPERRRPSVPFRPPGKREPPGRDRARSPTLPRSFRLIGTAVLPERGGFVLARWSREPPKIVPIGASIGEFVLKAVEPGRATLVSTTGEAIIVRLPAPGRTE